jgi:glutamate synthase (NADPH/NADH) large chain
LRRALDDIRDAASKAIEDGAHPRDLRPRVTRNLAPIPSLLAVRRPPPPGAARTRTQVGCRRDRRRPRGAPHRAADRLRRRGHPYIAFESIEDMLNAGRWAAWTARRRCRTTSGRRQGRAEGDVEDGHLDGVLLPARRSSRPSACRRPCSTVLHRADLPGRRHRPRRIAADVATRHQLAYLDRPDERAHRELEVGGEYQWRREANTTCSPRHRVQLQHSTRTGSTHVQGVHRARRRPERADGLAARPAEFKTRRPGRQPSTRWSRPARSSSVSPPAR